MTGLPQTGDSNPPSSTRKKRMFGWGLVKVARVATVATGSKTKHKR